MGEENTELIASKTGEDVAVADLAGDKIAKVSQHDVARGVAICVIHGLEIVEVEIEQTRRRAVAFGESDETRNFPHESAPVEDRQQGVLIGRAGHVLEARAGLLHLALKQFDFMNQPAGGFAIAGRKFRFSNCKKSA